VSRKWRKCYQNEVDDEIKGVDSRDKVKHNERSDQLFLGRIIMWVAEQEYPIIKIIIKSDSLGCKLLLEHKNLYIHYMHTYKSNYG